jgi:hypothetical protein
MICNHGVAGSSPAVGTIYKKSPPFPGGLFAVWQLASFNLAQHIFLKINFLLRSQTNCLKH